MKQFIISEEVRNNCLALINEGIFTNVKSKGVIDTFLKLANAPELIKESPPVANIVPPLTEEAMR